jgi:malonyl CoA-acyl carrier protein transacylase
MYESINSLPKVIIFNKRHLNDLENMMMKIQSQIPFGEIAEISNINSASQVVLSGTVFI